MAQKREAAKEAKNASESNKSQRANASGAAGRISDEQWHGLREAVRSGAHREFEALWYADRLRDADPSGGDR